jgi:2-hydroxycyclohexanecarboxyl-CoA dehydrogenase
MRIMKTVLITGAGGDLGRAFAAVFARAGYAVAGLDLAAALERFSAVVKAAGGDHLAVACDLRDWSQIEDAVAATVRGFGRLDVVINNAVVRTSPTIKPLEDCTAAELDEVYAVGPRAALGTMRAALPHLKESRGTVINIGSGAGVAGAAGLGAYGMAKAAMHSLTRSGAVEWGRYGITVNGILPLAMTEHFAGVLAKNPSLQVDLPPIGRMGEPERDIGAAALFLASPAAEYISGQNISVDGGSSTR